VKSQTFESKIHFLLEISIKNISNSNLRWFNAVKRCCFAFKVITAWVWSCCGRYLAGWQNAVKWRTARRENGILKMKELATRPNITKT